MSERPSIAVVIPSYNYARFLEDAVRSVWNQTWTPAEVIIADDESRDDSVKLAQELARSAPVPTQVLPLKHGGIIATLNRGVAAAKSRPDFLAFLAADDRFLPRKLERQVSEMAADPEIVLSHCDYVSIDAEGRPLAEGTESAARPPARGHALEDLLLGRAAMRTGPILRRDFFERVGGFDPKYMIEDWPLYLKAAAAGKLGYVDEPLVERRVHGANWSTRATPNRSVSELRRDACLDLLEELSPSRDIFEQAARVHLSVPLRVAMYDGHWGWALRTAPALASDFPSQRAGFAREVALGAMSYVWSRTLKKVVPGSVHQKLAQTVSGLRRSRG